MSYVQRFGINRNSPMNMVSPMKMGGEDNQATNVIEKQNVKAQKEKMRDTKYLESFKKQAEKTLKEMNIFINLK